MTIKIEVLSAKLNSEGLFLRVTCEEENLGLNERCFHKGVYFTVIEVECGGQYDDYVYTVVRRNEDVYKDQDIYKWVNRLLTLEEK